MAAPAQRLDKWLWYARIVKSRTMAQKLIRAGAVRVDSIRTKAADFRVAPGMVLTLTAHTRLRVLKIRDPGTRRGPATEAQLLYEDLSPELPKVPKGPPPVAPRPSGAGRPTKKQRRAVDGLRPDPGDMD